MKILHVISSIDPRHGGVTEGLRQLGEKSIELGCPVEVATLDAPGQPFLKQFAFPVFALGPGATHFEFSSKLLPWLRANIQSYDIAVIHGLWQYHGVAVRRAALERNVPYVVYTHGMLDPYFKRTFPLKHAKKWLFWPWADYRVLRDANAVLFTTEEERMLARQSFWLYSAREKVVTLGTSRPAGNPELQREAFYSRYPDLRGKRLALFLGRIHPKKGCDLVIESFSQVLASNPTWRLVMAGPDQVGWRAGLARLASALNIADRITWTGMIGGPEKWGALRSAEVLFLPSHQENFGVAVAEALACGLPALISGRINLWREVEQAGAALVATDTLEGAASLLSRWAALSALDRNRMRANALRCFEEKFEIHRATRNLLDTLGGFVPASPRESAWVNA